MSDKSHSGDTHNYKVLFMRLVGLPLLLFGLYLVFVAGASYFEVRALMDEMARDFKSSDASRSDTMLHDTYYVIMSPTAWAILIFCLTTGIIMTLFPKTVLKHL